MMVTRTPLHRRLPSIPHITRWASALALFTALSYLLIEAGIFGVGDLQAEEGASVIVFTAAACYALGGLLILLRRRWLWITGALINALLLLFFFSLYAERPAVLLSAGGLTSKGLQVMLELALIYLIVKKR